MRDEKNKTEPLDIPDVVDQAIRAIVARIDGSKGTIGDLIRLLQLRDEVRQERRGMIRAMWVEECEKTPSDE